MKNTACIFILMILMGCAAKSDGDADQEIIPVKVRSSSENDYLVTMVKEDDSVKVSIDQLPSEYDKVECFLNTQPLEECYDGAIIQVSDEGEYVLTVSVYKDEEYIGGGQSELMFFSPNSSAIHTISEESLALKWIGTASNVKTVKLNDTLVFDFEYMVKPNCDFQTRCGYGPAESRLWGSCTEKKKFEVDKLLVDSVGERHIAAQAVCQDHAGPVLELNFTVVPENYAPLMLHTFKDNQDRRIFSLLRPEDCKNDELQYLCSPVEVDDFIQCKNGNVLDKAQTNIKLRAQCGDQQGPILEII